MSEQTYQVSKEEYAELLVYRKEKILRKAQEDARKIDEQLAKLVGKAIDQPLVINNNVGLSEDPNWKEIIAFVLNTFGPELPTAEIIRYSKELPLSSEKLSAAPKSISSTLSLFSKGKDAIYNMVERNSKRYYSLAKN